MTGYSIVDAVCDIDRLADQNAQLTAAVSAIQKLHYLNPRPPWFRCNECFAVWPCPTITAIDKATS